MVDLIDRKELLRAIQNFNFNICCARATGKYRTSREKYEMYTAIKEQFQLIAKGMPKADTERHAHWCYRGTNRFYECNYCGNITYSSEDKYCSNCGCRMDEVVE